MAPRTRSYTKVNMRQRLWLLFVTALFGCEGSPESPVLVMGCDEGPPETRWMMCIDYGLYTSHGATCAIDDDCPAPVSPCEIAMCKSGACTLRWYEQNTQPCGDAGFLCNGSYCCGESGNPN